jgi:drug/metabolite transporter superfamily protein YnfA
MNLVEIGWGGYIVWINLGKDRSKWWAVMSTVMGIRVLYSDGNFLTAVYNNRVKFIFRCSGPPTD